MTRDGREAPFGAKMTFVTAMLIVALTAALVGLPARLARDVGDQGDAARMMTGVEVAISRDQLRLSAMTAAIAIGKVDATAVAGSLNAGEIEPFESTPTRAWRIDIEGEAVMGTTPLDPSTCAAIARDPDARCKSGDYVARIWTPSER